jgi:histidinol-phosphate phosphatase family protein
MKAVLLDRDGVINSLVYHENAGVIDSPFTSAQFKLLPRVPAAIASLNKLGLKVAVISNQPGIAKGHLRPEVLRFFTEKMLSDVREGGGRIDKVYYCLHHPEAKARKYRKKCRCRKPAIGLLEQAAKDFRLRLSECYMVGDGIPDLVAGSRAGCRTIFIGRWKCEICQFTEDRDIRPRFVAKDLWGAAQIIRDDVRNLEVPAKAQPRKLVGSCIASERSR